MRRGRNVRAGSATPRPSGQSLGRRGPAVVPQALRGELIAGSVRNPKPKVGCEEPRERPPCSRGASFPRERGLNLVAHVLAGAQGALHVAGPLTRIFGPGPVKPTDRLSHGVTQRSPYPGANAAAIAATRPFLGGPVALHVLAGDCCPSTEELLQVAQHRLAPPGCRHLSDAPALFSINKCDEHATARVRRGVVEHMGDRAVE